MEQTTLPLITVIIPSYNYGQFIREAVDSVLASDYPQQLIEIIIIDDGSTDNTADVVKDYGAKVNYLYIQNTKKVGAVKLGIELAKGKYIFNLDADDLFEVSKIRKVVQIFEKDNEIVQVSHVNNCWNVKTGLRELEEIPAELLERKISGNEALAYLYRRKIIFGGGSTYAARTEAIRNSLVFRKEIGTIVDEYLVITTMSLGYCYFIAQPLTVYRIHSNNDSQKSNINEYLKVSKLKYFANCTKAVEQQLMQNNKLTNEVKVLYQLKSKEFSLYLKRLESQGSLLEVVDLYLFTLKSIKIFGKHTFLIIWSYNLPKYLIPSRLFLLMRSIFK
jgi:glycosyltransferase involved in cell wall biosynthesis